MKEKQLITTTEVSRRVGLLLSVEKLESMGFQSAMKAPPATLWGERICSQVCLEIISELALTAQTLICKERTACISKERINESI